MDFKTSAIICKRAALAAITAGTKLFDHNVSQDLINNICRKILSLCIVFKTTFGNTIHQMLMNIRCGAVLIAIHLLLHECSDMCSECGSAKARCSLHLVKVKKRDLKIILTREQDNLRLSGGGPMPLDRGYLGFPVEVRTLLRQNVRLGSLHNLSFPSKLYRNMRNKISIFLFEDDPSSLTAPFLRQLQALHILMFLAQHLPHELQHDPVWLVKAAQRAADLFAAASGDLEAEIVCADALHELLECISTSESEPLAPPLVPWEPLFISLLSIHAPGFLDEEHDRRLFAGPALLARHLRSLTRLVRSSRPFFGPAADDEILRALKPVRQFSLRIPPSPPPLAAALRRRPFRRSTGPPRTSTATSRRRRRRSSSRSPAAGRLWRPSSRSGMRATAASPAGHISR